MAGNADEKLDRLFAAARTDRPDTSALEAHFETRLMAHITGKKSSAAPWYLSAWQMIPACCCIALICAACSVTFNPARSSDLFAAITAGQDDHLITSYLAGEQP